MLRDRFASLSGTGLARACNRLKETLAPSRDKLSCMVAASDLLDLGIGLMDTATVVRMRRTKELPTAMN
jgi:hypothetical protein